MENPKRRTRRGATPGRSRPLAWSADPVVLERLNLVRTLRAQGYTAALMLPLVNQLMARRGQPEIRLDTIYDDFARIKQQLAEERQGAVEAEDDARQRHIEELTEVLREAWRAFHGAKDTSLNRSAFLNTIRATVESIGKYDRSLVERKELTGRDGGPIEIDAVREEILRRLDRLSPAGAAPEGAGGTASEDV